MSDTLAATRAMGAAFQAIARSKPVIYSLSLPQLPDNLAATRGFYDRRSLALRDVDGLNLVKSRPVSPKSALMYEACLDALGEALLSERSPDFLRGARQNIEAAQQRIADPTSPPVEDYDTAAYIVALDAFRILVPQLLEGPSPTHRLLEPESVLRASARSLGHHLLSERLNQNLDLLAIFLHEVPRDLNALTWFISRQILDKPSVEEVSRYFRLQIKGHNFSPDDPGYADLKKLFDERAELRDQANEARRRSEGRVPPSIRKKLRRNKKNIRSTEKKLLDAEVSDAKQKTKEIIDQWNAASLETTLSPEELEKMAQPDTSVRPEVFFSYYKTPDRRHDLISRAENLIDKREAETILEGLYKTYATDLLRVNRNMRRLAQRLCAVGDVALVRELDEGIPNPARLHHVIFDPNFETPFMRLMDVPNPILDTTVQLLVDNSRSMDANDRIQMSFLTADRLSFWFSKLGISTEILGFTTGRSALPVHEGRAINTHHIIYKDVSEPHTNKTTYRLAAMLLDRIRNTNCDGEAILWAHERLLAAPSKRKIMFVISDQNPISAYEGDPYNPSKHLKDVVAYLEARSPCEIVAINLGIEGASYYTNSFLLKSPKDMAVVLPQKLGDLMEAPLDSSYRQQRRAVRLSPKVVTRDP